MLLTHLLTYSPWPCDLPWADPLAAQDPTSRGEVSETVLVAGLREVVQGALPWESFVRDLANVDAAGRVRYQTFLARYRVVGYP